MSPFDMTYNRLLSKILWDGEDRDDRTGVGTRSLFGEHMQFNLSNGFPLLTTKKMAWKPIVSELLWFLEGSTDERRLAEILYGKDRSELAGKKTIWTDNALAKYLSTHKSGFHKNNTGPIYGYQWRRWHCGEDNQDEIDQIEVLISGLKNNPTSRRHILSAWNVGQLDDMCLPPCHVMSQYYVSNNGELSCHMYQRSADVFLGVPFNIASYALLTHMLSQACDLGVGKLVLSFGDVHIYKNHIEQVNEQATRIPYEAPKLWLNPEIKDINNFQMKDIKICDYISHPSIKAEMAI